VCVFPGATSARGKSGIFSCIPKCSPGYQYRTSIDFGLVALERTVWIEDIVTASSCNTAPPIDVASTRPKTTAAANKTITSTSSSFRQVREFVPGRAVIHGMATDYLGCDYDILRKNCCTFAHDACLRLGVPPDRIPSWFRNLAETGAYGQDVANAAIVEPLQKVWSLQNDPRDSICGCGDDDAPQVGSSAASAANFRRLSASPLSSVRSSDLLDDQHQERGGFEVIARQNATNTGHVVVVVNADRNKSRLLRRRSTTVC
jgi:hypothetical protein